MKLQGSRPGDRRVRVEIRKPQEYQIAPPKRVRRPLPPAAVLIVGIAGLIAVGTILLMLPFSSASGEWTRPIDALFTATSAACVTGLVVLDTGTYWSPFGHLVILILIQVGGFGFMTGSTLLLFLLVGRRTGLRDRLVVQASTGTANLGSVTTVVKRVAVFTILAEGIGAILLTLAFVGRGDDVFDGLGNGVFHAVSAFNNAGFDLFGNFDSLAAFVSDPLVLTVVGILIILGGLGFAIVGDVFYKRRWSRFALETKIVVLTSAALLVVGTALIAAFEWSNPATLGALPEPSRILNAAFEATTLRTAGFSALPTGEFAGATLFIVMALMFIGGASGSTAGGIKVNTFSVLLVTIISTALGRPSAWVFGRRLPHIIVYQALSVALLSIAAVFVIALGLQLTADAGFVEVLFETVSAVGTVGASTGITPDLPDASRLILIPAMFAGRLGPLTLVLALAARARPVDHRPAVEAMRIG